MCTQSTVCTLRHCCHILVTPNNSGIGLVSRDVNKAGSFKAKAKAKAKSIKAKAKAKSLKAKAKAKARDQG